MVIAANGHHKVPFEDLLVAGSPSWQVRARPTLYLPDQQISANENAQ
jgi:hypothetical protein